MKLTKLTVWALCAIAAINSSFAAPKNDSLKLVNSVLEYVKFNADVYVSYPQLKFPTSAAQNIKTLAENINSDMCRNVAKMSVDFTEDSAAMKRADAISTAEGMELLVMQRALKAETEQTELSKIPFELYSEWEAFANSSIVSICQESYFNNSMMHGMLYSTYCNYLISTGEKFEFKDIIEDKEGFLDAVAKFFCTERRLPKNAMMAQTGLYMELSDLPFPSQVGLSKKGIVVIYQPYEIAPWAAGQIKVTIPFRSLKGLLQPEFFKISSKKGGSAIYTEKMRAREE